MPELPEVELAARALHKHVSGSRIIAAELLYEKLTPKHSAKDFARLLKNVKIISVDRRAKFIIFHLDSAYKLIVHLRMTGQFLLLSDDHKLPKHTASVFYLDNDKRLVFNDQRRFGKMQIVKENRLDRVFAGLAPEPFSAGFSVEYLQTALGATQMPLKSFLLDQTKVCGLGNIYANEAMHIARLSPRRKAKNVPRNKIAPLYLAIKQVLEDSIAHGSTLNVDPNNIDESYYGGGYEGHWRVYDRKSEPCPVCKTAIKRIVQSGRSTYFCGNCQK
jgi:formamidopyrimidine-DNA glycosylase